LDRRHRLRGETRRVLGTVATTTFSDRRSHAANADGFTFAVDWSDALGNDWSVQQVTQQVIPGTDHGNSELWRATLPTVNPHERFNVG
jgi:hypothetical protein